MYASMSCTLGYVKSVYVCVPCTQHGKPSHDWKQDSEGKPEGTTSKIVRSASKMTTKVTKMITKESGLIDDSTAEIIEGVADAVENQADAGHDASIADRVKMAGTQY